MRSSILPKILVVLLLSVGAASFDVEAAPVNAAVDPCALVAKSEVEKILGVKLGVEAEPAEGNFLGVCRYNRPDGQNVAAIALMASKDRDGFVKHVTGSGIAFSPVAGLAIGSLNSDAGLVMQPAGKAYAVLVTVNDYVLEDGMTSQVANPAKQLEIAKKLKF